MNLITQAKEILKKVKYVSMATVNQDGSPHNSPLVFLYDDEFNYIYWGSHPESQHSQNILRTGKAFFVAFDGIKGSTGAYVQTIQGQIVEGNDLVTALKVHNYFRAKRGKYTLDSDYYSGNSPQRMWRAKVEKIWINNYERDNNGRLTKDYKIEINPEELVSVWE